MILYIDTSTEETKIALYKSSQLLAEKVWLSAKNQSEELLFETDKLLKSLKLVKADIKKIVVVSGPGSYTGLRVGLSTANALAMTLNVEIVGIKQGLNQQSFKRILVSKNGQFDKAVMPVYLRKPKITKAKSGR